MKRKYFHHSLYYEKYTFSSPLISFVFRIFLSLFACYPYNAHQTTEGISRISSQFIREIFGSFSLLGENEKLLRSGERKKRLIFPYKYSIFRSMGREIYFYTYIFAIMKCINRKISNNKKKPINHQTIKFFFFLIICKFFFYHSMTKVDYPGWWEKKFIDVP